VRVDVHAHTLPLECIREMQRLDERVAPKLRPDPETGQEVGTIGDRTFGPFGRGMYDPEQRFREYRERGIDLQAVSPIPFVFYYRLKPELGTQFARILNDAIAEIARAYSERCVALATVPLQAPDRAVAELERAIEQLGCRGVEIGTNVAGRNLDEPDLEPFWSAAERLDAFVFVHPEAVAAADRLQRYYLTNLIGNPLDTTIAIASVVFSGLLDRHPNLKICFAHGGGFAPYQRGRFDHGWRRRSDARGAIERPPSEYLQRLYFDTILHDAAALDYLIRAFGSDHVLLGTDYPFDMGPDDLIGPIGDLPGLGQADRDAIMGGNAARLLGLG
jgi:aminocarboxymuconate-semialdehyde decarboxylase